MNRIEIENDGAWVQIRQEINAAIEASREVRRVFASSPEEFSRRWSAAVFAEFEAVRRAGFETVNEWLETEEYRAFVKEE